MRRTTMVVLVVLLAAIVGAMALQLTQASGL